MKHIFFTLILILFSAVSCSNKALNIENLLINEDKRHAQILSYSLVDNNSFDISFSERVEIKEVSYNGEREKTHIVGKEISLPLPYVLERGEKYTLALTFSKNGGNTFRAYFTLYGKNTNKAVLLINEVSVDGNASNPDRVELLVIKDGNTGGMMVTDELENAKVVLPAIDVARDDIIVIYWDSKSKKDTLTRGVNSTYYVDGGVQTTLISTTGAVLLYDEVGGTIIDALPYSDFTEASLKKEKFISLLAYLIEIGEWEGEAVPSDKVTASRVLSRLPGGWDTNSAEDWFTTAAKASSFGYPNAEIRYEDN